MFWESCCIVSEFLLGYLEMVLYLIEDNTQGCCIVTEGLVGYLEGYFEISFLYTKPKPAYGRQDLYLIVGPEHSFRVFSM